MGLVETPDPSLRSGFRLRARTPAKRLNLLKKILPSTLGVFRKMSRQARPVRFTGRGGCMGRSVNLVRFGWVCLIVSLIAALTGCSSSSPTTNTVFPVPGKIILNPSTPVSLTVGSTSQAFTATTQNNTGTAVTTPVQFISSNTAVLTIASNGIACAGTWDSLSVPQICTPGPGRRGCGDRHLARHQQPTDHGLRPSAHRQNLDQPNSRTTASLKVRASPRARPLTIRLPPSARVWTLPPP